MIHSITKEKLIHLREKSSKFNDFVEQLATLAPFTLAFSGGVDSTFLLGVISQITKFADCQAVTIKTPYIQRWELTEAQKFADEFGVKYSVLEMGVPTSVRSNPVDKCYYCKTEIFKYIKDFSQSKNITTVIDGTNYDDADDYRPGMKALAELNVKSPMLTAKITKSEIRTWSKSLGLDTWDKPSYACLLTRLQPNQIFTSEDLYMVEAAERELFNLGMRHVRVRKHAKTARIEVDQRLMQTAIDLRDVVSQKLIDIGYEFVTLDLVPYRKSGLKYKAKGEL